MDQEVRDVLLKAKSELSKGWIQGGLRDKRGVCLYGALFAGEPMIRCTGGLIKERQGTGPGYRFSWDSPRGKAVKLLAKTSGMPFEELAEWNDDPERTAVDVVELIDKALASDPLPEEVPVELVVH